MNIRIAGTVGDSIVDGPGLRLTVFTQGCPHHCPGCHNPETHDPAGGHDADTGEILAALTGETVRWVEGARFPPSTAAEEMEAWLAEKGIAPYPAE